MFCRRAFVASIDSNLLTSTVSCPQRTSQQRAQADEADGRVARDGQGRSPFVSASPLLKLILAILLGGPANTKSIELGGG
jgi:hypothetical protein